MKQESLARKKKSARINTPPAVNDNYSLNTLENCTFDEIDIGRSASLTRTLQVRDIELFAALSGDINPTHLDRDYTDTMGTTQTGHSLWGSLLISNLLGNTLPGPGTVYRSQSLQFKSPPTLGDILTVTITVNAKNTDNHTVTFDCAASNQNGDSVFSGTAEVFAPSEKIIRTPVKLPRVTLKHQDSFSELIEQAAELEPVTTAVVHPCEATSLEGAVRAAEKGLIIPVLVGPEDLIKATADENGIDITGLNIVATKLSYESAEKSNALVQAGEVEILMKGSLHTDEIMSVVVSSKSGLRTNRRISHALVMDIPTYAGPLIVTDAAINISPDIDAKRDICQNAIDLAQSLGIEQPKVAILSAVETVTVKIPSTIDAAALCKMSERGQITGAILDGPLAMDNAISAEAAHTKGIKSVVAGDADILLVPDLDAGNILYKQLIHLAHADAAGVVLGASVPVVLTSRSDNIRTRLASCAVAKLLVHMHRQSFRTELLQP